MLSWIDSLPWPFVLFVLAFWAGLFWFLSLVLRWSKHSS